MIESRRSDPRTAREFNLHLRKLDAEIARLISETSKLNSGRAWHPIAITTGWLVAAVALVAAFMK